MLKSYEAIYERGQVKWLSERPSVQMARIIVTVLEDIQSPVRCVPDTSLSGETFWQMSLRFRTRMEQEGIEFTDEDFSDLRNRSLGREVFL